LCCKFASCVAGFDPSLKEYALLTHSSQHLGRFSAAMASWHRKQLRHLTGVAAKVNPSETSLLTFRRSEDALWMFMDFE